MRAIVVREFGPFDQARPGELAEPVAGSGEVVVDIAASEVNFPDLLLVEGNYQKKPALPFAPGMGGAGVVSQVGAGVTEWQPGQRVLVLPDSGTHAEKVAAPAGFCFPVPDDVPFDVAAVLGLAYQTAHFALVEQGRFRAGETVLVLGAKGGVGMAAVQLAKALGAGSVIAATRGAEGAEAARASGADHVVDAAAPDLRDSLRDAVMAVTGGRGADVVIDPVGGPIGEAALRAMAWRGRLVVVGFASGRVPVFKGNYLLVKGLSVSGFQWTDYRARQPERVRQVQAELFRLWSEGRLRPEISQRLPLDRFAEALADLRAGRVRGKIVLSVRD
ncbi:NADPH:quinone oxidoreductase family protein [Paracoccus sp. J39]|uniref:NADPH:quinone oxidoreductase family protein n=1 Tax=Paracoccus sp. J39 TaxID=935848 RepID=UPI00048C40AE|nr:NADPH:quinone oxidoreductase family protein [Paracoccus sp. J39]